MNKLSEEITNNIPDFMESMFIYFPWENKSNVFYNDFYYGIQQYFKNKNYKLKVFLLEIITKEVINELINQGILKTIQKNIWNLNYLGTIGNKNIVILGEKEVKND